MSLPQNLYFDDSTTLFSSITQDIIAKGYRVRPYALPENLAYLLLQQVTIMSDKNFKRAGVGRAQDHVVNDFIRTDEICWISDNYESGKAWISWAESLRIF